MEFKVGDLVVHPAHGVGKIVRLEKRRFSGVEARLYYEVLMSKSTIWIPTDTSRSGGLRPLTAKSDLARYRDLLKSRPNILDVNHRKRSEELAYRLRQSSFQVTCEIVRDLTARSWKKHLCESDNALLHRVRERLYQEWSASEGITLDKAIQEVEALLQEARLRYMS